MRYVVRTVSWAPERLANVEVLKGKLPDLEIHIDRERDGYKSLLDVCKMIDRSGAVLMEDDIALCADFRERVESIIAERGNDKVYNFFEKPKVYLKTAYVGGSNFLWMQCIYLPPGLPAKIARHYEEFRATQPKKWQGTATDCLIAYALTKERVKYWRIRPCLVQHLPFPSVIGSRPTNRQSPYFIDLLREQGLNYDDIQPSA